MGSVKEDLRTERKKHFCAPCALSRLFPSEPSVVNPSPISAPASSVPIIVPLLSTIHSSLSTGRQPPLSTLWLISPQFFIPNS